MCKISLLKESWPVRGALAIISATVFIAGCPIVDDNLFYPNDTDSRGETGEQATGEEATGEEETACGDIVGQDSSPCGRDTGDGRTDTDSTDVRDSAFDPCDVVNIELYEPCADGYRFMDFVCSEGTFRSEGDRDSCRSREIWEQHARRFCYELCMADTSADTSPADTETSNDVNCAVVGFDVYEECEGGYRSMNYVCSDGTIGWEGDGSSCEPEEVWRAYARRLCSYHCIDNGPIDTSAVDTGTAGRDTMDTSASACRVVQFDVREPCDDGFSYAEYECSDGRVGRAEADADCQPAHYWETYALDFCAEACVDTDSATVDTDSFETGTDCGGVVEFELFDPCDGGFFRIQFYCADGSWNQGRSGDVCFSVAEWERQAIERCIGSCR